MMMMMEGSCHVLTTQHIFATAVEYGRCVTVRVTVTCAYKLISAFNASVVYGRCLTASITAMFVQGNVCVATAVECCRCATARGTVTATWVMHHRCVIGLATEGVLTAAPPPMNTVSAHQSHSEV